MYDILLLLDLRKGFKQLQITITVTNYEGNGSDIKG